MVSSAFLKLVLFLLAILIPAWDSSSLAYHMMYSAYKLNKQGDNIQPRGSDGKDSACNVGDLSSIPGSGKLPVDGMATHYRTLLREFYGQRGLEGYSPWNTKELGTTELLTYYICKVT